MELKNIKTEELHSDCFTMIGKEWMLITAEKDGKVNTMTASWGGMGILWNKKVAFIFIRPQRYTKQFVDASTHLSLTFFDENYRKKLSYLGSVSGKDEDKIKNADLHIAYKNDIPYFKEANTVILGKKIYMQNMEKGCFLDKEILVKNYPNMDLHTIYVIEIEEILAQ